MDLPRARHRNSVRPVPDAPGRVAPRPDAPVSAPPALPDVESAVLPIDKPQGLTSFDVIRRLRRILNTKKIGHAGTLDPMATGLLVCLVGRATKLSDHFLVQPKAYAGTIRLGEVTPSQDADSEVTERRPLDGITEEAIRAAAATLTGSIEQIPPMYSAVKIGGERLYKKARRGEEIERAPRPVVVYRFDVEAVRLPDVDVFVACSKGTYVRTLAYDLGARLGVGGHLVRLRRTAIGDLNVENAWTLDALAAALAPVPDA